MKKPAILRSLWCFRGAEHVIANFSIGSIEWRIRFSASAKAWLEAQIGHSFEADYVSQTQGPCFIKVHGIQHPGLKAYRGV